MTSLKVQAQFNSIPVLVKLYTIALAGNANQILQADTCEYLFLKTSTGSDGDLSFSFDDQSAQALPVGLIVKSPAPLKTVQILNNTGAPITLTVILTNGVIDFKGLVVSNSVTTTPAQTAVGVFGGDVAIGAAAVHVFVAVSNLAVILTADPANADVIYVGFDNTTTNAKKVLALTPGSAYTFNNYKGDLWAYSPTAAQKLSASYM